MNNNNKPTHNLTAEGRALVHAILEIGLTTPANVADVFVKWSPHCSFIEVDVHKHGWEENVLAKFSNGLYLDHAKSPEDAVAALAKLKAEAEAYIAEIVGLNDAEIRAAKAAQLRERAAALTAEAAALEGQS